MHHKDNNTIKITVQVEKGGLDSLTPHKIYDSPSAHNETSLLSKFNVRNIWSVLGI